MSQLAYAEGRDDLVGAILVVGVAILVRDLLYMIGDLIAGYFMDKALGVITEAMNEKAERLELIDFETLDANERLELAKAGMQGAIGMLIGFLYPVLLLFSLAASAVYLHSLSPPLALVVPVIFAPRIASHLIRGSRYYRLERRTVPTLREFRYLEQCLVDRAYYKETRCLGIGSYLLGRYRRTIHHFNVERWRESLRVGGIDLAINILVLAGYGGCFVLAALLLARGDIDIGGFAVVVYALSRFMALTGVMLDLFGQSYQASATAAHLVEFLRRSEGRPMGDPGPARTAPSITAQGVTFTYPGSKTAAVAEIDLAVKSGTTIALVGANGSGKTTLAKLLLGLYVPSGGTIVRGGNTDTKHTTRHDVRARTSAVFQNFQRYQMTLRENVILADVAAATDDPALRQALSRSGVRGELWQGDGALDVTLSREFGTRDLSIGEWQRLAIARGLFRTHDTIVLDEPTASIDPLEESAVYERFIEAAAGRTAIVVTHRLGSARLADHILVMQGGRIVEEGTHEDLIRARGLYHEMFSAQAAWYERGDG